MRQNTAPNNNDYLYAEMLEMMKAQGQKVMPTILQIGVMQSPTSVKIGDLILNIEDLYFAEHLLAGYEYPLTVPYVNSVTFGEHTGEYATTDIAVKAVGLKKGDIVAVQKLNNTNLYVVLEKVVRAG